MARFDQDSFRITYSHEGRGPDDTSLWRWTTAEPFPLDAYGPAGGAFTAEVVQRRDGRWGKWRFLPRVSLIHRDTIKLNETDSDQFSEPMETLPVTGSFDGAIAEIKDYVRRKVNERAWVGHEDEAWWV